MGAITITTKAAVILRSTILIALSNVLLANAAQAQSPAETPGVSNVTVVTLYSETRNTGNKLDQDGTPKRPPIQIVNGGVKGPEKSCWELSPSGKMTPVAGDCYILRSAGPGEEQPAR